MEIKKAEFTISSARLSQCPKDNKMEFAFIGRSNVGKSSLINMLCNHKGLAKTSATPGKTLLINHFLVETTEKKASKGNNTHHTPSPFPGGRAGVGGYFYIVDLPGYGFAKRSKKTQDDIERMISSYILQREQLVNVFLLIDIRHDPQQIDREFMDWLGTSGIPFSIVFTKADKLSPTKARTNAEKYMNSLLETWEELPPYFITSSEKKEGRDAILDYIDSIIHSE